MSRSFEEAQVKARAQGHDGSHGSSMGMARDTWPTHAQSRRRCGCGCGGRATHTGGAGGVALMGGCEMQVRRWARDGYR